MSNQNIFVVIDQSRCVIRDVLTWGDFSKNNYRKHQELLEFNQCLLRDLIVLIGNCIESCSAAFYFSLLLPTGKATRIVSIIPHIH